MHVMSQISMRALGMSAACLMTVGCTPTWERQASELRSEYRERPLVHGALSADAKVDQQTVAAPESVADLDALVQLGLDRHPAIRAQQARVAGFAHQAERVGVLPPPRLQVTPFGDMAQTAAGEVQATASLSQNFPAPGALRAEVAAVTAQGQAAEAQLQAQRTKVAASIRRSWWQYRMSQDSRQLVLEQIELLGQLRTTLVKRSQTSQKSQGDILRLEVTLTELRTQIATWDRMLATATARLVQSLSLRAGATLPRVASVEAPSDLPDEAVLIHAAHHLRSDVMNNQAEKQRAAALADRARSARRPAFGLHAAYALVDDQNERGPTSGDDQWSVGFSLTVPLWYQSYAAGDQEAAAILRAAQWSHRAVEQKIQADVVAATVSLQSLTSQVADYENNVLAQARRAYEAEIKNLANGASSITDVLQSWRQALAIEQALVRLRHDQAVAEADLLQAIGATSWKEVSEKASRTTQQVTGVEVKEREAGGDTHE